MLLSMSPKELNRVDVIRDINERRLRQKDAAELLKLSRRHIQRLVNQYSEQGPAGLVSLRRGKPSNRRYTPEFKQQIIDIVRQFYIDFGPTFANEKLREKHQLKLSTETLRQWMMAEGFWVSKRQAKPKVY
ncbi:TPA: helix-turn-helix domain-containing protein [Photobacterium damselae]